MSATLVLSPEVTWMPRGALFERVLTETARALDPRETALASLLAPIAEGVSWLRLGHLPPSNLAAFLAALRRAYADQRDEGEEPFQDGEGYTALIRSFSLLQALVRTDPRVHDAALDDAPVRLSLPGRSDLELPSWAADLVVEHLHAFLRPTHPEWSPLARIRAGLPPESAERVDEILSWMRIRYAPDQVRDVSAPAFLAALARHLESAVRTG